MIIILFSSAQKRLYVVHQLEPGGTGYNMPYAMTIDGPLDEKHLETVFSRLINRHESLRTSFHLLQNTPVQKVHDRVEFGIRRLSFDANWENGLSDLAGRFRQPFELTHAPLFRAALAEAGDNSHILLIDMHHIVSDGVSMAVITREFMEIYAGEEPEPLNIHYKGFFTVAEPLV